MVDGKTSERGIVLLELLVSLMLLALVASSMTYFLYQLGSANSRSLELVEQDKANRLQAVLRSMIADGLSNRQNTLVAGDAYEVRMQLVAGFGPLPEDAYTLVLKSGRGEQPASLAVFLSDNTTEAVFTRQFPPALAFSRISYFGDVEVGEDVSLQWTDTWEAQVPPQLMRFDFIGEANSGLKTMIIGSQ